MGLLNNTGEQYRHGGAPAWDMARLGIKSAEPVIDFSVNLNPFGPPDIIKDRWTDFFDSVECYPAIGGEGIIRFYQEKMGVSHGNILPGNGSTELIYLIPRVLGLRSVSIINPSYHDYERASLLAGVEVRSLPLSQETDFSFPGLAVLRAALEASDALWFGRPNNPTAGVLEKEIILDLADESPDKWVIVDEAFMPFMDGGERDSLVAEGLRDNILVILSLTKFYSLAGLRMGAVAGTEAVVARLREAKEPWTVNGIAETAAEALLVCADYEEKTRTLVSSERKRMSERLEKIRGVKTFPAHANFFLCRWTATDNLDDLVSYLLKKGLYIRDCRNFEGLKENFFRICVRMPGENDRLLEALDAFH